MAGLTFRLGQLPDALQTDASNNVGIGGSPSGSYKLEVTGTAKVSSTLLVSGALTLSSTISNGTYTYTLPSATGTLALTSSLSSYLPLSAGTGNKITGDLYINKVNSSLVFQGNTTDALIYNNGSNLSLVDNATGLKGLILNVSTGAATFSSSVTSTQLKAESSLNGDPELATFTNSNAGTGTEATIYVRNSSSNNDGTFIQALGTAFTTTGGFVQDGGVIGTGTGLSGGLSLMVRANADMRFYTNGHTNERMRITSGGVVTVNQALSTYGAMAVKGNTDVYTYGGFNIYNNTNINFISIAINTTRAVIGADYAAGGSYMPLCFETGNTERMRIFPDGQVSMNTTSILSAAWLSISVASNNYNAIVLRDTGTSYSSGNYYQLFTNSSNTIAGSISHNTITGVNFNTSSDYRLKEDLKDFDGLDILSNIKFYDFKWKDEDKRMHGVIAHELESLIPLAVSGTKDGIDKEGNIVSQGVDYSKLVPILGKAIQELSAQNQDLKSRLDKAGL